MFWRATRRPFDESVPTYRIVSIGLEKRPGVVASRFTKRESLLSLWGGHREREKERGPLCSFRPRVAFEREDLEKREIEKIQIQRTIFLLGARRARELETKTRREHINTARFGVFFLSLKGKLGLGKKGRRDLENAATFSLGGGTTFWDFSSSFSNVVGLGGRGAQGGARERGQTRRRSSAACCRRKCQGKSGTTFEGHIPL